MPLAVGEIVVQETHWDKSNKELISFKIVISFDMFSNVPNNSFSFPVTTIIFD